ncbi:MAG: SDR family NAD(P)-dependent oxidoreductase [Leptospiraceae bacterium]|nr:SDR family NAD(P)-dependent oxidoreductase [Leptospiraceae bacterium]
MKIYGNTALITGGTSGIGRALAGALYAAGNRILITGRNPERLNQTLSEYPDWQGLAADLRNIDDIQKIADWALGFEDLNILVNNAGIQSEINFLRDSSAPGPLLDELRVNLEGPIRLIQECLPSLLSKAEAAIINVTSALGEVPLSRYPIYSASKAALSAYSYCLRTQLANTAVQVFDVVPPFTDTPMNEHRSGSKVPPAVVADAVLVGVKKNQSTIRPGKAALLHRIHRLSPGLATRLVEAGS